MRRVSRIDQRVQEAAKLGFTRIFIPKNNIGGWTFPKDIEIIGVTTITDSIRKAFGN